MGNAQCTAPIMVCQDQPEERTTIYHHRRLSSHPGDESAEFEKESDDFLRVHIEDRPEKCIIDHGDVVKALVEQSLELIRRDNEDASLFSQSSDGFTSYDDDGVSSLHDTSDFARNHTSFNAPSEATIAGKSSVYAGSEFALSTATAATTDTNATRQVQNRYDSSERRRKRRQPKPPQVLGTAFHESEKLQQDLQRAITKVSKRESDAKRLGRLVRALQAGQGCAAIPATLLADPIPDYLGTRARKHMTILHLRIKPRFTEFYQSHLSRLLPDNPFTQAVTQGISLSKLSPPRKSRASTTSCRSSPDHLYHPPLNRTYSDSSDSADIVEFGQGPPSQPISLLVTGSNFADLGLTGSLGLANPRRNQSSADSSRIKPPSHYSVLINRRSGVPLAVCALKTATTGPPVVRIYVTKRRLFGQRPAATTKKLGLDWCGESFPLYPWAEIVTEGRYPNRVRYSIFLAKGNDGRFEETPSYRAEHASVGSPEIRVVGKTERDSEYAGCAILSLCREEGSVEEDDLFINLSVARGIDPALLICFAQVVDEAMEKTMRHQFAALSEGVYRRS